MRNGLWMAAALIGLSVPPALAGQGADLTRQHLYAGTLAAGIDELAPLAAAGDAEAQLGMGFMQFTAAAQDFVGTRLWPHHPQPGILQAARHGQVRRLPGGAEL